jgi:hypothetical protein
MKINIVYRKVCENPLAGLVVLAMAFLSSSFVDAQSTLNFPRLDFDPNTFTGIAIVNPSAQDAVLTFAAYGQDGQLLADLDLNPVQRTVLANQQLVGLTSEFFTGSPAPSTVGWFQVTSSTDDLTGFFLFVNGAITEFDGADLPASAETVFFNQVRVDSEQSTELNIINPNMAPANLQLQLVTSNPPVSKSLLLPANGMAQLDAATFFEVSEVSVDSFVKVTSDVEIAGFEMVRTSEGDLLGLNARDGLDQLTQLFFPQMAVLGPWKTELGLVNYSSTPAIATISVYRPDGSLYDESNLQNNPVAAVVGSDDSLLVDLETLFGFTGDETLDGWLLVESSSEALNGFISYGLPGTGSVASVTSSAQGQKRAIFSHIATFGGFFTGLAVLNSGQLATNVTILAIQPTGEVLGSFNTVLQPGERLSKLIDEMVPASAGQNGGIIWVKSDLPVHLTSIFGSSTVLANIPPQPAVESYQPDGGLEVLQVTPSLAVLQPEQAQAFEVSEAGSAIWKVNDLTGGDSEVGTITPEGVYQAPMVVPDPRVLTITAEVTGQTAGASVDVLEKESLLSSQSIVQSVVFLGSLQKLYTAELAVLNSSGEGPHPAAQTLAPGGFDSEIFAVVAGQVKTTFANFSEEEISKMISFEASNGKEFLLVAAKTSGRIIRLDPAIPGVTRDVATGLNQPESMVIDPVTGDLLVADLTQVTTVAKSDLEAGLAVLRLRPGGEGRDPRQELFPIAGADGIAVDRCTGTIYTTNRTTGEILAYSRRSGELRTVLSGLQEPTRLLSVYRGRVSCPDSFHLLAIERGTDQILLVLARQGTARRWISARQSNDISFIPRDNNFVSREAVLLTETAEETEQGTISAVSTPDLYKDQPDNPPRQDDLEEVAPEPEPGPDPQPEPEAQADVLVELSILSEQVISVDCGAIGTAEFQYSLEIQVRGDVKKNGGATLAGVITGSTSESLLGTGVFSSDTGLQTCTSHGPIDAVINQTALATDVSGVWDFQFVTLDICDDGDDSVGGGTAVLNINQTGDQLSGSFLEEEGTNIGFLSDSCELECAGDGTCTATCPEDGVSCTLTCNNPDCGEGMQVTGTVSQDPELPPTAEVEFTAVGDQRLAIACTDPERSTRQVNNSFEAQFSGTFRGGGTPVISGSFSAAGGDSCDDTGAFSAEGGGCEGLEIDTGYWGVVFTEGVPRAPANLSGLWTLLVVISDEVEADGFQFNVNQVGDAFSTAILDDDLPLPDDCSVNCSGSGQCTAFCPELGSCSITCDPATQDCAEKFRIDGTVQ